MYGGGKEMNKNKIRDSLPTVLFISGIAGIFVSEIMVARDTLKAEKLVHPARYVDENENYGVLSIPTEEEGCYDHIVCETRAKYAKEIITRSWKCYIPTAIATTATLACLIASNRLTKKQIALLSSAVAGAGSLVSKYRDKIREHVSPEVLAEIDKEVAKEEITKARPPVISTSGLLSTENFNPLEDDEYLFFDPFTKVKFRATKLGVLAAKYYLNRNFALGGNVGLDMFYGFLGLTLPEEYLYCGWDCNEMGDDGYYWVDIDLVKSDEPDPETGEQYYIIEYGMDPGECEDSYYPYGNPIEMEGSHANS
jgi:hypothetical protein